MEVFVIPVGPGRYELYYEQTADVTLEEEPPPTGFIARLRHQFGEILRRAEQHHQGQAERTDPPRSWMSRVQDRLLLWIAERIADQRLLWNLRKQTSAVAVHPCDVSLDEVRGHIQRALQRDFERHRFWLVVDGVGLVISGAFAIIPGPNLLAYFFLFRVGGHWLSMVGANQGRRHVSWTGQPSEVLDELRSVLGLEGRARGERLRDIALRLRLRNLPVFFERVATKQ